VDIIRVLTQQSGDFAARKYWKVLKGRLAKEGSQLVTNCYQLKMPAADGKSYLTDVATAATLLRLVQSVPSPKAETIKLWLAKVDYERMQELADAWTAGAQAKESSRIRERIAAHRIFIRGGKMYRAVAAKKKPRRAGPGLKIVSHGGAREARTPDLLNAIQTLYQLSYDPVRKRTVNLKFFRRKSKHFRRRAKISGDATTFCTLKSRR